MYKWYLLHTCVHMPDDRHTVQQMLPVLVRYSLPLLPKCWVLSASITVARQTIAFGRALPPSASSPDKANVAILITGCAGNIHVCTYWLYRCVNVDCICLVEVVGSSPIASRSPHVHVPVCTCRYPANCLNMRLIMYFQAVCMHGKKNMCIAH